MKYTGIKTIEAEPMSRQAAEELLGHKIKPADGVDHDNGYLVTYDNNYQSWSPKDVFEKAYHKCGENPLVDSIPLMLSADYKEQFLAEYMQLCYCSVKLRYMLDKMLTGTLGFTPSCSYNLLRLQSDAMDD